MKGEVSQTRWLTSLILCQSQSAATLGTIFHMTLQKPNYKRISKDCSFAMDIKYKNNKK